MIPLTKDLKIRLLQAIKTGVFDSAAFPELVTELQKIQIELINSPEQVRHEDYENKDFPEPEN